MTDTTNFTFPQYSEDHPKFGANAKKAANAPKLQQPEPALTFNKSNDADGGLDSDWAGQLSAAFQAKRGAVQDTTDPLSREFIARRALRQDSSATLVDFARRPSRTNAGKFRLEVTPTESAPSSSELKDEGFGKVKWAPGLNPLQKSYQRRPSEDLSGGRRGSRDSFRDRMGSDATLAAGRSRGKSRQGSTFWAPTLPDVEDDPSTPSPTREDENPFQSEQPLQLINPFSNVERGQLKGSVRTPSISEAPRGPDIIDVMERPITRVEPTEGVRTREAEPLLHDALVSVQYPVIADPIDPARRLGRRDLVGQRTVFSSGLVGVNAALAIVAMVAPARAAGVWVLAFILFIKSKDCLSSILGAITVVGGAIYHYFKPLPPVESKWILSLIPAYSESEEQIVKTVFSLRDNGTAPHKQVMCIILDGKERNIKQHMRITRSFRRQYVTSKFKRNDLVINAGFMDDVPVISFEKVKNAGKKDSLILCHDLFNVMRDNAPLYTKLLRKEIEREVLPALVGDDFPGFDMVFCTDADSTIHKGAIADLANAIARDPKSIASCGLVLVELEPGAEWSFWNLYQQFQYTFGQFVRRQAESVWGKVTCLPGCITMVAVRPEMAGAIRKYAEPITAYPVLLHQVQYLGTDRRLTYSMLSQSADLHTIFVPSAVSETVAPQSLKHYLSQRRRWGSNAYFNNYFYAAGENMIWITRLCATIELTRLSLVYYRVFNTALFIYGLTKSFHVMKIIPLLVVSQLPTLWYLCNMAINPHLRVKSHKLLIGLLINKFMGPVMSLTIFTNVVKNLGSQAWGMTGGSNATATPVAPVAQAATQPDQEKFSEQLNEKGKGREDSINTLVPDETAPNLAWRLQHRRMSSITTLASEEAGMGYNPSVYEKRRQSSVVTFAVEEAGLGVIITPEELGAKESEVDEMDEVDPVEKIVGQLAAGL
ncbi:hypothetical protein MBLNU459_g6686t1 [Dothideomycetes sp. NU459]